MTTTRSIFTLHCSHQKLDMPQMDLQELPQSVTMGHELDLSPGYLNRAAESAKMFQLHEFPDAARH